MTPVEAVARAIDDSEVGYSMQLVRLVDGVHTYRLTYSDGEVLEFSDTESVYDHVRSKKMKVSAKAAIRALAENVTDEMVDKAELAAEVRDDGKRWLHAAVRAAILAAMEDE